MIKVRFVSVSVGGKEIKGACVAVRTSVVDIDGSAENRSFNVPVGYILEFTDERDLKNAANIASEAIQKASLK